MSRKGQAKVREVAPDPKFHDRTVAKFVNIVMERGKKSVAERILYGAIEHVAERTKEDGLVVFKRALENVRPAVEVRSRRVGGANYQVPVEVRPQRRTSLAMRWLVAAARARGEKSMQERLAARFSRPRPIGAGRSRNAKIPIGWRRPTRPSPIIAGNTE